MGCPQILGSIYIVGRFRLADVYEADSLLNTKGDINSRAEALRQHKEAVDYLLRSLMIDADKVGLYDKVMAELNTNKIKARLADYKPGFFL